MSDLDTERCYRAVVSRDARFDGRFFTGVTSTGIYCRPVCPSRTPRRENTRFFRSAAEAEGEGFRPCLRCRPETAPGSPAWRGTRSTISQSLRLVAAGYLDGHSVEELAGRLGMGPRHLRRLFHLHLGTTPVHVAQVRRLHFARGLLTDSTLPVAEVAFASGFGSLRQFNELFLRAYGQPPAAFRGAARTTGGADGSTVGGWLELRLRYRPPYPWQAVLGYLARRAVPGVEEVRDGAYRRSIAVDGSAGMIEVRPLDGEHGLLLRVSSPVSRGLIRTVERVRRLFDLDADPEEIGAHLGQDPRLSGFLAGLPGVRVPGAWDGFELAVRAVVGQQVSVAAATRLMGGLAARYGEPFPGIGGLGAIERLFPTPERLAGADPADLRTPRARARALLRLAQEVRDGEIVLDGSADAELVKERLKTIPGIGEWTAEYVAMRALGDPDAFPAADLGLLRAAAVEGERLSPSALLRWAEAWRPWRAYAAMALWNGRMETEVTTDGQEGNVS